MILLRRRIIVICGLNEVLDEAAKGVTFMDGRNRGDVVRGADVSMALKENQRTGKQIRGIVRDLLKNSSFQPYGIDSAARQPRP